LPIDPRVQAALSRECNILAIRPRTSDSGSGQQNGALSRAASQSVLFQIASMAKASIGTFAPVPRHVPCQLALK